MNVRWDRVRRVYVAFELVRAVLFCALFAYMVVAESKTVAMNETVMLAHMSAVVIGFPFSYPGVLALESAGVNPGSPSMVVAMHACAWMVGVAAILFFTRSRTRRASNA